MSCPSKEMDVVVGTYEKILLGYKLSHTGNDYSMQLKFTNHDHAGAVKAVAISQKGILASGSTDETIHLFSLRKNVELGSLVSHTGTITWLDFIQGGHLLSASTDHSFALWRHFTWQSLHVFQGHKDAVNCVAVHPTSKLALSVSSDKTLRTWDLTNNRCAYITSIKEVGDIVQWSPDGARYVVVINNKISIYTIKDCSLETTIQSAKRINCVLFLDDRTLVYGGEGGQLFFYNTVSRKQIHQMDTETVRIRGLVYSNKVIVCASTDGQIKVYEPTVLENSVTMKLVLTHNTQCRILCMAVSPQKSQPTSTNQGNEKRNGTDEQDVEADSDDEEEDEDEEDESEMDNETDDRAEEEIDDDDDDEEIDDDDEEEEIDDDDDDDDDDNDNDNAPPHPGRRKKQAMQKMKSNLQTSSQGKTKQRMAQQSKSPKQTQPRGKKGKKVKHQEKSRQGPTKQGKVKHQEKSSQEPTKHGKKRKGMAQQAQSHQQTVQQGKKRKRPTEQDEFHERTAPRGKKQKSMSQQGDFEQHRKQHGKHGKGMGMAKQGNSAKWKAQKGKKRK